MKKCHFKVKDLKEFLKDLDDDTEIFIKNSLNPVGNISEMSEAFESSYGFFGTKIKCIIFDSAQNFNF